MIRPTVIATLPKMPAGWTWSQPSAGHWAPVDASLMQRLRPIEPIPPQQEPRSGALIRWPGVGELFYLPAVLGPWQYRADGHPGYERLDVRGAEFALRTTLNPETDQWWWYAYDVTGFYFTRGPAKGAVDAQEQAESVARLDGWLLLEAQPEPDRGLLEGSGQWVEVLPPTTDPKPWSLTTADGKVLAHGACAGNKLARLYLGAAVELLGYEVPA